MTKELLKDLPLDTLFDLMIKTFKELLDAKENKKNKGIVKIKKKEVELLQIIIVVKVVELHPVDRLLHSIFSN